MKILSKEKLFAVLIFITYFCIDQLLLSFQDKLCCDGAMYYLNNTLGLIVVIGYLPVGIICTSILCKEGRDGS